MSKFKRFVWLIIIIEMILIIFCNVMYIHSSKSDEGRLYRVEAKRLVNEITEENLTMEEISNLDLSGYETIISITEFMPQEPCNDDYIVESIRGKLYRIAYRTNQTNQMIYLMNIVLLAMLLVSVAVFVYVYYKVLKPFQAMSNLSYELAKGNLSTPIKEEKSKLFGRFLWGMDMLREKLEDNKEKELEFQKDRKTLILSLSHDIKTPLSSIDLYAKALAADLYDTKEKKDEAIQGISRNVREIKGYVDEIVKASREDFLHLEVEQGEVYLSKVIEAIRAYYKDKLAVVHTDFTVEDYSECLVKGDHNRLIEVLQNIMENAIKYGDGKRISISFEDEEDCKLIHIENSGNNLKEEDLPNLFDSFYRGSNSHGIKGNGLGLYICKTLMRKMDGDVYAKNSEQGFAVTVVVRKA